MSDYAQRLAAHPRWRWEPGMVAQFGLVAGVGGVHDAVILIALPEIGIARSALSEAVPYIHHPATRGWLLAWLQRDALAAQVDGHGVWCEWVDGASTRHDHYMGDDALAAALLAVWGAS